MSYVYAFNLNNFKVLPLVSPKLKFVPQEGSSAGTRGPGDLRKKPYQ